ncbi:MAG: YbhB/YbcL family Raf kinase inhibitor-like protein [Rhodospirillum sp.]|nr:YbhB/YbcL family Raf kinase inhibitor-like protein [Rhodospirillum sp.]MCF8489970.1 YbhB/YbcL family Raf kinase inhibitor-like protein [Rhodospirillum sp.]MCF8501025.1 YbhB/YbcL family Raf kinase inhibitor-like protein [Rhodospirillum sp.]
MAITPAMARADMTLTSPAFTEGATLPDRQVFDGFGCTGGNVSPALSWTGAPEGTKSFALLVHDPDAPTGGAGWWHWTVFDIPADVTGLPEGVGKTGTLPEGAREGRTDFGSTGYGGACPPEGDSPHRYNFTLHALDVTGLPVETDGPAAMVGYMINAHTLDKVTLSATYGR